VAFDASALLPMPKGLGKRVDHKRASRREQELLTIGEVRNLPTAGASAGLSLIAVRMHGQRAERRKWRRRRK
jgi:hypothetical protein